MPEARGWDPAGSGSVPSRSPVLQRRGGGAAKFRGPRAGLAEKSETAERRPSGYRSSPKLTLPPSRSPVPSQAHLSPRLTCATGRRMKRRARPRRWGRSSLQAPRAPRPGGRSGPALGPGCSVPPCPRPPTSCVAPREEVARSAGPGGPQVGSPAGKARAGRLRLRDLAGGYGWARPGHLAVPPASPSPPGRWAPT